MEEEDGSSKIMQTPPAVPATNVAATPAPEVSPPKKKRPGRPPKNKKKVRIEQNLIVFYFVFFVCFFDSIDLLKIV